MVKADIDTAHPQDCLLGRGHSLWPGNMRYRQIISSYRADYERATKNKEKKLITIKIVDEVCKNGGRFLKEDPISGSLTQVSKASARLRVGQALRHQLRSSRGDVDDSASSISQAAKKQTREQEGVASLPIEIVSFQDEPKAKEESPTVVSCSTPKEQEKSDKMTSLRSIFDDQEFELMASEESLNEDLEPTPIRNLPLSVSSVSMKDDSMLSLETSRKNNAPILPYSPISAAHQQQQHQNQKDANKPITTIEQLVYSGNIAEALLGQLRNQQQGSSSYSSSPSAMAFPRHYARNSASYYPSFDQESSQQQEESNNLALAASLLQSSIGEWS